MCMHEECQQKVPEASLLVVFHAKTYPGIPVGTGN